MFLTAMPGWVVTTTQTTFLTSVSGSNQTYNVPAGFVSNVSVEVISGGANGDDETTDGCGNGNGDQGRGGSGNYTLKNNVSMTPGGTQTYHIDGTSVYFGGTTLAGSVCGSLCCGHASNSSQTIASIAGAKGDTITQGNVGDGVAATTSPPAAAIAARVGSGVANAGAGCAGNAGTNGQGIIKIVNLVAA